MNYNPAQNKTIYLVQTDLAVLAIQLDFYKTLFESVVFDNNIKTIGDCIEKLEALKT